MQMVSQQLHYWLQRSAAPQTVAQGIQSLGGTVRFREDDVDYIRAIVPIDRSMRLPR
jgi:hypothetical protein